MSARVFSYQHHKSSTLFQKFTNSLFRLFDNFTGKSLTMRDARHSKLCKWALHILLHLTVLCKSTALFDCILNEEENPLDEHKSHDCHLVLNFFIIYTHADDLGSGEQNNATGLSISTHDITVLVDEIQSFSISLV